MVSMFRIVMQRVPALIQLYKFAAFRPCEEQFTSGKLNRCYSPVLQLVQLKFGRTIC